MKFCNKVNNWLKKIFDYLQSPLLLVVRLVWGFQFFWFAGRGKFLNIQRTADFFETLNIPWPLFNAYMVASVEMFGGFLLMIGLFSRLAALPLTVVMVTAYATAHSHSVTMLFTDPSLFFKEPPFLFLYASLLVLSFGPGFFSVDEWFKHKK